jgi:hypothetical protein
MGDLWGESTHTPATVEMRRLIVRAGWMFLTRIKKACSTKQDAMVFCELPLIGQTLPMNGAQLHPSRVCNALSFDLRGQNHHPIS